MELQGDAVRSASPAVIGWPLAHISEQPAAMTLISRCKTTLSYSDEEMVDFRGTATRDSG